MYHINNKFYSSLRKFAKFIEPSVQFLTKNRSNYHLNPSYTKDNYCNLFSGKIHYILQLLLA